MKYPITQKYIDIACPPLFVFGSHDGGVTVDISDINQDVFTHVPRDIAVKIIEANSEYMNKLYKLLKG